MDIKNETMAIWKVKAKPLRLIMKLFNNNINGMGANAALFITLICHALNAILSEAIAA
ncbi:hypothetical protein FACS1894166_10450 [Bacilli bacterium]|nr:hypothetical protein FACS1894166_10450 [Bacilli bacterium]